MGSCWLMYPGEGKPDEHVEWEEPSEAVMAMIREKVNDRWIFWIVDPATLSSRERKVIGRAKTAEDAANAHTVAWQIDDPRTGRGMFARFVGRDESSTATGYLPPSRLT